MTARAPFATGADGVTVDRLTLSGDGLNVALLTRGSILQDVRLDGLDRPLVLGSERLTDYEGPMHYHGAIVGPVGNRIAGARAVIAGREHLFPANQSGRHILHSGLAGTYARHWEVAEQTADAATLTVALPDGEGGFPGNRRLTVRWQIVAPATLRLTIAATTDAETLMNPVAHPYWSLGPTPSLVGHRLAIAAERWLPTTEEAIPTGEIVPVAGTPYDFRAARLLEPGSPPIDHNFCLSDHDLPLREVMTLTGPDGVALSVATTAPGLQIYDGRDGGGIWPAHAGLAVEPQLWPDAPNHPGFPSILLRPGERFEQVTEWRLSRG